MLVYTTLIAVVLRHDKPGLGARHQRHLVPAHRLAPNRSPCSARCSSADDPSDLLAFACLAAFRLGLVLYLIVMTMVFLRWTFQPLEPTEADPPAWIAAGAVAITVLAGSNLLAASTVSARVDRARTVHRGRGHARVGHGHVLVPADGRDRRVAPHRPHASRCATTPSYWALVFPLGMYGAATYRMRGAIDLDALGWLPGLAFAIALSAWLLTFAGLVHSVATGRRDRSRGELAYASSPAGP